MTSYHLPKAKTCDLTLTLSSPSLYPISDANSKWSLPTISVPSFYFPSSRSPFPPAAAAMVQASWCELSQWPSNIYPVLPLHNSSSAWWPANFLNIKLRPITSILSYCSVTYSRWNTNSLALQAGHLLTQLVLCTPTPSMEHLLFPAHSFLFWTQLVVYILQEACSDFPFICFLHGPLNIALWSSVNFSLGFVCSTLSTIPDTG